MIDEAKLREFLGSLVSDSTCNAVCLLVVGRESGAAMHRDIKAINSQTARMRRMLDAAIHESTEVTRETG